MLKLADYFNKHDIDYDMRYIPESKAIKYTFVKHGYRVILEETIETLKNLDHSSCLVMNFIMGFKGVILGFPKDDMRGCSVRPIETDDEVMFAMSAPLKEKRSKKKEEA